jgi:prepilin-type N-terminal cleavage/methylation domain-containing protein
VAWPRLRGHGSRAARGAACARRRGFSLLEAIIAVVLVGVVLLAAFHVLGGTTKSAHLSAQRGTGLLLAEELMAEVLPLAYADPDQTPVFGPETGETVTGRNAFDDVDDYAGWETSPPRQRDGTILTGYTGWKRTVNVVWADPNSPDSDLGYDGGAKRITVAAWFDGKPMATLVALRTDREPGE